MTNTIGYVSTQQTQTTEEMNTDLDLNSSVELVFKTDYLPLDRLAGREQVDRIKVHTLNPEAEAKAAAETREAREKRIGDSEAERRKSIGKSISAPPSPPPPPKPGEPGSIEAADKARKEAEEKARKEGEAAEKARKEAAEKPKKDVPGSDKQSDPKVAEKRDTAPAKSPADEEITQKGGTDSKDKAKPGGA